MIHGSPPGNLSIRLSADCFTPWPAGSGHPWPGADHRLSTARPGVGVHRPAPVLGFQTTRLRMQRYSGTLAPGGRSRTAPSSRFKVNSREAFYQATRLSTVCGPVAFRPCLAAGLARSDHAFGDFRSRRTKGKERAIKRSVGVAFLQVLDESTFLTPKTATSPPGIFGRATWTEGSFACRWDGPWPAASRCGRIYFRYYRVLTVICSHPAVVPCVLWDMFDTWDTPGCLSRQVCGGTVADSRYPNPLGPPGNDKASIVKPSTAWQPSFCFRLRLRGLG